MNKRKQFEEMAEQSEMKHKSEKECVESNKHVGSQWTTKRIRGCE